MSFTAGYKVNENTDYEFTVSDETLQEIIEGDGITESDITDYCYTALHDSRINALHVESSSAWSYGPSEFDGWVEDDCAFRLFRGIPIPTLNKGLNEPVTDVYERNLLTWYGTIYPGTENEKTGTFLVMDMQDIKKWYADYTATMFSPASVSSTATKYGQTSPAPGYTGSCYTYISNNVVNYSIEPAEEVEVDGTLRFLNVFVLNDELWVGLLNPSSHGESKTMHSVNSWYYGGNNFVKGYLNITDPSDKLLQRGTTGYYGVSLIPDLVYESAVDTDLQTYPEGSNGIIMYGNCANSQINLYSGDYAKDLNTVLTWQSWCGIKFKYDNTMYKPIIQGGVIVGYSDDMDAESEYDDMTNVTGNNISPTPPVPPAPGGDDDNTDPITTADAPFGSGIAHYYAMTADSVLLQHVSEALSTWDIDTSKKDLYRNLISCKLVKPPAPIPVSGSEDFTIYGVVPQYQGAGVKLPVINGNPSNTFGPYTITRKFNDFRDFAPYSKAEIFLPFCGWTALPSHVIGRSVTVKYFTDIIAATCKAVVFCNNNVVAEAAGIIGLDIPFAAENVGAKMEAANMGLLSSTLGAVQAAVGVGTMVSTKSGSGMKNVTSGLSQVISGCTQISMAGNENWTEINGKAGDGCSLSGVTDIIIKITRPKYGSFSTPPYVPSGYAHNIGYVAMKQTKPGNVSGLLVCDNVDTSGISGATQRERELIKAYLESGIIVNAAPSP